MDIGENVWAEFIQFRQTCRDNPVFPECSFLLHVQEVLPHLTNVIPADEIFYRARIFHNSFHETMMNYLTQMQNDIENSSKILEEMKKVFDKEKMLRESGFNGFDAKDSFVNPNPKFIGVGRCNHAYETCLYLAEDVETAIGELKPLIKEKVSVAKIKVKEELKIIDLTFGISNNPYAVLSSFLFVTSPTQDDYDVYNVTQIICSLIKKNGYDGIKYTSCQNILKSNYVIFNYDKCEAIASDVYTVNSIKYGF